MADIVGSSSVFTNSGSGDLLQQAFQQVVDEDDQENEFVAFLQSDTGESQVIQLTAEQAAALGITIKVNNDQTEEQPTTDFQNCSALDQSQQEEQQQTLSQEESQRIINELAQSGLIKHNSGDRTIPSFDDWNVQENGPNEQYQSQQLDSNLSIETIKMDGIEQKQPNVIKEQRNNVFQVQLNQNDGILQEQDIPKSIETQCTESMLQNTIQFSIANTQVDSISQSQAQILQRFPVILPSSQFIIKSAQPVITPVKNIRILPNTSKASTTVQSSQNSLLLPKTTLINTLSPQLIKALPIGTQFLSTTNNIAKQLSNTSRIFSKTSDSSNSQLNNILNTVTTVNSTLTQSLAHKTSMQKPVQVQIQHKGNPKANVKQFFTPILRTASNSHIATKSTSLLNSSTMKQNTSGPIIKTIQYPSQGLKTRFIKSPVVSLTSSKHASTPVIFRTTPMIKTDDTKISSISTPTIRTQISNNPVSILKPQAKITHNLVRQNHSQTFLTQKNPSTKSIDLSDTMRPLVGTKFKQSVSSLIKGIKKKNIPQKLATIKQESIDTNKPLGSSENPIQIVQQGHTFHSMQRLTQAQLKQIAQVLHQRSKETSANSNEKVVYRLVFPDEMDVRIKSPNSLLKNRANKRGRPKKNAVRSPAFSNKTVTEEDFEDTKEDRKKIVARTRSGRLSRPPRHMVRDYKHLHHLDFMQPDLDDSDGGYSDYNTSSCGANKTQENDLSNQRTELLAGLEVPKRKISDHFRCPTCSKIYLGRTRMARHFEMHPDHGSPDQLPPPTVEAELKQTTTPDPLKRKGKKRGPWAYVTPEAKSERRQSKLQEAISVCESSEIAKIAAKPVVNSLSLFDLLVIKSENNARTFLNEIKELVVRVREKTSTMLSVANNDEKHNDDVVDLNEELLCDVLALNSGFYRVNEPICIEEPETEERISDESFKLDSNTEPPLKVQKTNNVIEEGKENLEERLSSGFSESSDLSVSDFLNERRNETTSTVNCPEVLSALTLMPRNNPPSTINDTSTKINNVPKVSNTVTDTQTSDSPGFQKLNINVSSKTNPTYMKEGTFSKLGENLDSNCTDVFMRLNGNYDQPKLDNLQRTFIKLEPTEEGFIKLENGMLGSFHQEIEDFGKIQSNGFHYTSNGVNDNFNSNNGFRKLVPKTNISNDEEMKVVDNSNELDQNSVQIVTNSTNHTNSNIFGATDNLDITKISSYDHISHLEMLNGSSVIDKNLIMDEKLVEHLHLVDNSNIVDELVSERLKSMMPETLLESNLLHNNGNLDTELDFEELSEEFNRNTRS